MPEVEKPSSSSFDLIILGAGCAGLSLAAHLLLEARSNNLPAPRTLLLDARAEYGNDRSWCFWDTLNHPFRRLAAKQWEQWSVSAPQRGEARRRILCEDGSTPYLYLPSTRFYAYAQELLASNEAFTLQLATPVTGYTRAGKRWEVHTAKQSFFAPRIFDARAPRGDQLRDARLLQHFRGWFVRSQSPCFDASTAELMNFHDDSPRGVHFTYVLPFSAHDALVEDTYFSAAPLERSTYEANLRGYLAKRGVQDFEITGQESGVLPMDTSFGDVQAQPKFRKPNLREPSPREPSPREPGSVLRLGVAGGAARPATGYAFLAIQKHCKRIAQGILRGESQEQLGRVPYRSERTLWLDRVLLAYLQQHPQTTPSVFLDMFERVPAPTLARFLSEQSTMTEELQVMRSVPMFSFASQVGRAVFHQLRAGRPLA